MMFLSEKKMKRDWTLQETNITSHIPPAKTEVPKIIDSKRCRLRGFFSTPPDLGTVEEVVGFWWFWIWHLILLATDTSGKFNGTGRGWQLCYGGSSGYSWSPWKNHSLISMDFHHLFRSILFKKKSNKQMVFKKTRCFFPFWSSQKKNPSKTFKTPIQIWNPAKMSLFSVALVLGSPNPRFCNRPFSVPPPRRIANYPLPPRWLQTSNPSVRRRGRGWFVGWFVVRWRCGQGDGAVKFSIATWGLGGKRCEKLKGGKNIWKKKVSFWLNLHEGFIEHDFEASDFVVASC